VNAKNTYRMQLAATILLALLFTALVNQSFHKINQAGNDLNKTKTQALTQEKNNTELTQSGNNLKKYRELSDLAKAVVPKDKNQAEAVRQIVSLANQNGVALSSITFPASNLGSSTTTSTTYKPSKKDSLSQLKPVAGLPGVYELMINISSDSQKPVAYGSFINFLSSLESNRLTSIINSVTITPSGNDNNQVSFVINLNEYIKP